MLKDLGKKCKKKCGQIWEKFTGAPVDKEKDGNRGGDPAQPVQEEEVVHDNEEEKNKGNDNEKDQDKDDDDDDDDDDEGGRPGGGGEGVPVPERKPVRQDTPDPRNTNQRRKGSASLIDWIWLCICLVNLLGDVLGPVLNQFLTIAPCDAAEPWQLGFQDAATPMMQGIIDLHHDIFFFLILILVFVSRILVRALWHFHYQKNPIPQRIVHGTTIEILRTIFPSIIPMFIAIPSFALLYSMDEVVVDPAITIKAIGHQWYRTYEYSDYNSSDEQSLTFDSYTIPEDDLELGQSRLLEVDNRVVVPAKTHLRIIVTPADVPHSWAVPSLGVKCDAVPGRLNQISISVQREGVYYGQCSEICGTNHAFTRAPGNIGRLLSPLWLSRTTRGASHPKSKLLQRAAGAVGSRGARQ